MTFFSFPHPRKSFGHWRHRAGSTIRSAGDITFLNANHLKNTLKFDKHLHASSKDTIPHPRHNLPEAREYIRELGENDLGMMARSTPSSAVDSESEDRTSIVRKHRGLGPPLYHLLSFFKRPPPNYLSSL